MSDIVLSTPRLDLRPFRLDDAQDLFGLNADPEVLRYTGDPPFESVEAARQFVRDYDHYDLHSFGRWALLRRDDGAFLGWCGLKRNEENEVDLGFRIRHQFWGKGYATEAATACVRHAFDTLSLPYLIGRAEANNLSSHRVLEKVGMRFWRKGEAHGFSNVTYWIAFAEPSDPTPEKVPAADLIEGRVALRALSEEDHAGFFLLESNPKVLRYADGAELDYESAALRVAELRELHDDKQQPLRVWAATDARTREFIGTGALVLHREHEVEVGLRILESHWNRGYGRDTLAAVLRLARTEWPSRRRFAVCDARNTVILHLARSSDGVIEIHGTDPSELRFEWP